LGIWALPKPTSNKWLRCGCSGIATGARRLLAGVRSLHECRIAADVEHVSGSRGKGSGGATSFGRLEITSPHVEPAHLAGVGALHHGRLSTKHSTSLVPSLFKFHEAYSVLFVCSLLFGRLSGEKRKHKRIENRTAFAAGEAIAGQPMAGHRLKFCCGLTRQTSTAQDPSEVVGHPELPTRFLQFSTQLEALLPKRCVMVVHVGVYAGRPSLVRRTIFWAGRLLGESCCREGGAESDEDQKLLHGNSPV
jgi:hypothetical protein